MNADTIPAELRDLRQWVVFRVTPSKERPGKLDKFPITAPTLQAASSTDPTTWSPFADCLTVARQHGLSLGLALTEDDPFAVCDLDDALDDAGNLAAWARPHVDALNSYSETSISRHGVHVFLRGTLPPEGRKKGKIEVYDAARFIIVTGDVFEGRATIAARQAELEQLHEAVFGAE